MKTKIKVQGDPRQYKVKITSNPTKRTLTLKNGRVIPRWETMVKLAKNI